MGGTESKTTVNILTDICINVVQQNINNCVQAATQQQIIDASHASGDVVISGVNMTQGAYVNMDCVMTSTLQSSIQSDMANAIAQYAETQGIAVLSALGKTKSEAVTNIQQIFSANVTQTITQEAVMQSLQLQKIDASYSGRNVTITDVNMSQGLEMTAKAILQSAGYSKAISEVSNLIDQTAKAKEENPLQVFADMLKNIVTSWIFLIVGLAVTGAVVAIFFFRYLFTTPGGQLMITEGAKLAHEGMQTAKEVAPVVAAVAMPGIGPAAMAMTLKS